MSVLCIFWHSYSLSEIWYPSFDAPVVTHWVFTARCRRCGLVHRRHLMWDGEDMIEVLA